MRVSFSYPKSVQSSDVDDLNEILKRDPNYSDKTIQSVTDVTAVKLDDMTVLVVVSAIIKAEKGVNSNTEGNESD